MDTFKLRWIHVCPLVIGLSFVVGRYVPAFYDWTGSDQSRPSPLILPTAAGLVLLWIVACSVLPWLPMVDDRPAAFRLGKVQFTIRKLLVTTAVAAVLLAVLRQWPMAVGGGLLAISLGSVVPIWFLFPQVRWQAASLLACMYFPFAWLVSYDELGSFSPAMIWMAAGLSAFFPTVLISSLVRQHFENLVWLSMLLSGAELGLGLWIIRLGPRRTIAYLLFVLLVSTFGSFVLNALVRM